MSAGPVAGRRLAGRGLAHPFLVHPFGWLTVASWSDGRDDDGAAALVRIAPRDRRPHAPVLVGVGEPSRLAVLLRDVAADVPEPAAVSLTRGTGTHAEDVLARRHLARRSTWDRLAIEREPDVPPGTPDPAAVELLDVVAAEAGASSASAEAAGQAPREKGRDAAAVEECLAASNPTTSHRPGDRLSTWYGWRDADGTLAAVACATTPPDGGLVHLGGIGTRPERRGRGFAAAVTARATSDGVRDHGLVVLGMYDDNDVARRVYERLGFELMHEVETWRPER
ncbi:GNAT family N-acetyltransferase [Antribacter gilvus]|uniref:GNAT family N-acetyltransferase n=1 Tax=Antribacter gilvus TaxID=2304675 RepID=UPI001980B66E|nr:GNAT family N-acetyltransferase [Antribacter gilvus]